jgi:hypothetical protein
MGAVLDLEPLTSAARDITAIAPLGYDAFEAEIAGGAE